MLTTRLKGIEISETWLKQSIDYIGDQGAQPLEVDRLANKVYELFLDSDIYENNDNKDVIPANFQVKSTTTMNYHLIFWVNLFYNSNYIG